MSSIFCSATHPCSVPWLLLLIRFFLRRPCHFQPPLVPSYLYPASCLDITRLLFRHLAIHFLNLKALFSVKPSYFFHPFRLLNLSESPCRQWPSYHWLPRTPFLASISPGFLGAFRSACHLVITDFLLSLLFDLADGADTFLYCVTTGTIEPETIWMPTSGCVICLLINKSYGIRTWQFPKISGSKINKYICNKISPLKMREEGTPKTLCILNTSWYKSSYDCCEETLFQWWSRM